VRGGSVTPPVDSFDGRGPAALGRHVGRAGRHRLRPAWCGLRSP